MSNNDVKALSQNRRSTSRLRFSWLVIALLLAACASPDAPPLSVPAAAAGPLADVQSWAYQLQNISIDELETAPFDLLVIDQADDDGRLFSPSEIARLQASGKIVLAYFSIGEAESYRPYWQQDWVEGPGRCPTRLSATAPDWLSDPNPEWCDNYPVRFWHPEWQQILYNVLDTMLAAGFNGVYLDRVDVFAYWLGEEDAGSAVIVHEQAAQDMADLVNALAAYSRQFAENFIIVPQNGTDIIAHLDESQQASYLESIDGIAVEDTFFFRSGSETGSNAPYHPQAEVLILLNSYQAVDLPVFAVDYLTQAHKIEQFYEEAQAHGYVPYATGRDLDRLNMGP